MDDFLASAANHRGMVQEVSEVLLAHLRVLLGLQDVDMPDAVHPNLREAFLAWVHPMPPKELDVFLDIGIDLLVGQRDRIVQVALGAQDTLEHMRVKHGWGNRLGMGSMGLHRYLPCGLESYLIHSHSNEYFHCHGGTGTDSTPPSAGMSNFCTSPPPLALLPW